MEDKQALCFLLAYLSLSVLGQVGAAIVGKAHSNETIIVKECEDQKLDVIFVVDKSKSIQDPELTHARQAVRGFIKPLHIGADTTRVGMIVFSRTPELVFDLDEYDSYSDLKNVELVPRPKLIAGTYTGKALDMMVDVFASSGRKGVKHVAVVVTDGKSSDSPQTKVSASKIHRNTNITVVAIGIGSGVRYPELDLIASGNNGQNVILAGNYKTLAATQNVVSKKICEAASPSSNAVICPSFCVKNGHVTLGRHVGDQIQVTCSAGYSIKGSGELTCQEDGSWSDDTPSCEKEIRCPGLTGIDFGRVGFSENSTLTGGVAKFSCKEGYRLDGKESVRCGRDGKWSADPPRCLNSRCIPFARLTRGEIVSQDALPGGTVVFACSAGHKMVGKAQLRCEKDGAWNGEPPVCQEQTCRWTGQFRFGTVVGVKTMYLPGDRLTFSCHDGYYLNGTSQIKCDANGQWSQKAFPNCQFAKCPWYPFIRNMKIIRDGDKAIKFECKPGYKLVGEAAATCRNGAWTMKEPASCTGNICKHINSIRNGYVENYSRLVGSKITIKCVKGYKAAGKSELTCKSNLKWSSSPPKCVRDKSISDEEKETLCPYITDIHRGKCSGGRKVGDVIRCTCLNGAKLVGNGTLTCGSDLTWDNGFPKCDPVECPVLNKVLYTRTNEDIVYTPGGRVTYSCEEGYRLVGSATLTCQADGQWSAERPRCEVSRCSNVLGIHKGVVSEIDTGDLPGSTRLFKCINGYHLEGKRRLTCQNGSWSDPVPKCVANSCPSREHTAHGVIKGRTTFAAPGMNISISCDKGYQLDGPPVITCLKNLTWSANSRCKQSFCDVPKSIKNGRSNVNADKRVGGTLTVHCNPGFTRNGNKTITCQSDLRWSSPVQECLPEAFCQKPCLAHGSVGMPVTGKSGVAYFLCDSGYTLNGPEVVKCRNGVWETDPPTCELISPEECKTTQEIMIVTEVSARTKESYVAKMRDLVVGLASNLNLGKNKLGLITYNSNTKIEVGLGDLPATADWAAADFMTATQDDGARLSDALQVAYSSFSESKKHPRKVLIMVSQPLVNRTKTALTIQKLRSNGIAVVAAVSSKLRTEDTIALSAGSDDSIFMVDGFAELDTKWAERKALAALICNTTDTVSTENEAFPQPEPEAVVCQNKPLDIYFVVDISKSINKKELKQERDALRHLFDSFEIARGKTRIGLIKFHSLAETELTLGEQETNAGLRETKVLTRGKIRGGTRTDMAMNMMMDNFGKDTSSGRAKVCILLTDGRATAPLDKMIDRLHKSDIKTVAIGIGNGADTKELSRIASGEGTENVYIASKFEIIKEIARDLVGSVCDLVPSGDMTTPTTTVAPTTSSTESTTTTSTPPPTTTTPPPTTTTTQKVQTTTTTEASTTTTKPTTTTTEASTTTTEATTTKPTTTEVEKTKRPKTTVAVPTKAPEVCRDKPIDVIFVVDISKSIGKKELEHERGAIRYLLNSFDIGQNKSRVGLVKYHFSADNEIPLGKYSTREELSKVEILSRGDIKGGTRTDLGMNMMMDKFAEDKQKDRTRISVLLTDGKATASLEEMIARLAKTDIKAIAIGVGKDAVVKELSAIATGEDLENVYTVSDFKNLKKIATSVVEQACVSKSSD